MSCSKPQSGEEDAHLRMVLVGKTGAGKSATGNTIIGEKRFKSTAYAASVTAKCQKETVEFGAQTMAVVDTPGLFDTVRSKDEVTLEIAKCISFAAPGPHVFLVVIQAGRFTKEEQETVRLIQQLFGEKSAEYTMALFTRGDDLEADGVSIDDMIRGDSALKNFISQCGGGYHVFNNRSKDPSQVTELLKKINSLVQSNGGRCFTNEMLQEAERAIKEKQEQLMKENPTMTAEDARKEAEENNVFIETFLRLVSVAGVGALGGAIMTAAAGEATLEAVVKAAATGATLMVTGAGAAAAGAAGARAAGAGAAGAGAAAAGAAAAGAAAAGAAVAGAAAAGAAGAGAAAAGAAGARAAVAGAAAAGAAVAGAAAAGAAAAGAAAAGAAAAGAAVAGAAVAGAAAAGAPAVGTVALASVPAVVIAAAKVVNEKCVIQ